MLLTSAGPVSPATESRCYCLLDLEVQLEKLPLSKSSSKIA